MCVFNKAVDEAIQKIGFKNFKQLSVMKLQELYRIFNHIASAMHELNADIFHFKL